MRLPSHREISLDCPECGKETLVAVQYEEINCDPRDGYREYDYTTEVVSAGCRCEDRRAIDQRAIEVVEA